jgi:hypothetical protein
MTRTDRDAAVEYLSAEGLAGILDEADTSRTTEGVFDAVAGKMRQPIPPQPSDLARLHKLIRTRLSFTVLEFGVGYSTIALADALAKNEEDWSRLPQRPEVRNRYMFQLFSVDASKRWIRHCKRRIPSQLMKRTHLHHSRVSVGTFRGQLCHFYDNLPDVVPDFIYVDGPSPKDVRGSIRGLSFRCDERTVMAGDLLLMEPTFLPGTLILIDGRTNNARFLIRNLLRSYEVVWDRAGDYTSLELKEERLGRFNVLGQDFAGTTPFRRVQ